MPCSPYKYDYWLKNAYDLLDSSQEISKEDKERARAFVEHLKARSLGTGRLAKHLLKLRTMLEMLGVPVDQADRKEIEGLVRKLEEKQLRLGFCSIKIHGLFLQAT